MPKKPKPVEYGERTNHAEVVSEEAPIEIKDTPTGKGSVQRAVRKSVDTVALLKGVTEAFSAEEVTGMLVDARSIAIAQNSWEGLLAISKFILEYSVGKPVQRSVSTIINPALFAKKFMDDQEDDGP